MRYFDFPANLRIIDRLSEPKLLSMDWRHNRPFRIALLLCVTLAALAGIVPYFVSLDPLRAELALRMQQAGARGVCVQKVSEAEALVRLGKELTGVPSGLVTLGLVPGVAGFMAAALYGEVAQRFPEIRLRVIEGYSGDMEVALSQGRIDMAILNRYRARGSNSYRKLADAQICVVGRQSVLQRMLAPVDTALPASMALQTLERLPLVLPVPPNAIRNLLDEQAGRQGVRLNVILEASSSVILKSMLAQHDCATLLPRHAVSEELACGSLAAIALAERVFRQHVVLATSSQRPFTLAGKAVATLVAETAGALMARQAVL